MTKDLLIEQIAVALKDEFIAKVEKSANAITLSFLDGKVFSLVVKEK